MDLRELEAVVAVDEHGSFSSAAAALFISQPALTRRVALLERELDLRLLIRSPRGVFLTAAGRALIAPARRALREAETIRTTLDQMHGGSRGSLLVAGAPPIATLPFARLIAEFHEAAPEVDVRITSSESTAAAVRAVESGSHDLALVDAPVESESVIVIDVWEDDYLVVYTSKEPRWEEGQPMPVVTAALLRDRPMIHLPDSAQSKNRARALFEMVGIEPSSSIETQHCDLLVSIARAGRGVAVVPRSVALRAWRDGAHIARPPMAIARTIGLARRKHESSPTIGRFLRLAVAQRKQLAAAS